MGRHAPGKGREARPARDECESLSVIDVAREGVFREGGEPVGWVGTLDVSTGHVVGWVPLRVKIEGNEGVLTLYKPFEDQFRIEARAVKTPHKRHWFIECHGRYVRAETGRRVFRPCGRFVRVLVRPHRGLAEDLF